MEQEIPTPVTIDKGKSDRRRKRSRRLRRKVRREVNAWFPRQEPSADLPFEVLFDAPGESEEILTTLPRPSDLGVDFDGTATVPSKAEEKFKAGFLRVMARLPTWFVLAARWTGVWIKTIFTEKNLEKRDQARARALRRLLQGGGAGPTAIKVGQQMSLRLDIIPYAYAHELEKLLDKVPAFSFEQARKRIEESIGEPLEEIFSAFDPEPVGKASIACVYQAVLRDGKRVAVKVRRPKIGRQLVADLRAMRWVLKVLEIVYLPPDFTKNLLRELETTLMEELDFEAEARSTDLFRREAKKGKQRYVTTPKIHFDLSSKKVLVMSFVSGGYKLGDIVKAVETENEEALAKLERLKIKPKLVAHRLLKINRFGGFEALFFHADLHPANVMVMPGSKLVLLDFGSVGAFTREDLNSWRRLMFAQSVKDVGSMVKAALAVSEPLPAINVAEFTRRLEAVFFQDLYAYESKHSEWWERTSANIWISFLKLSREYGLSMNLNTLKQIRGTMLVDTIAARLDNDVDHYKEFRKYERGAGKRAAKRLAKRIRKNFLGPRVFLRLEQVFDLANTLFYRTQRIVDADPLMKFVSRVKKSAMTAILGLRALGRLSILAALAAVAVSVFFPMFESHFGVQALDRTAAHLTGLPGIQQEDVLLDLNLNRRFGDPFGFVPDPSGLWKMVLALHQTPWYLLFLALPVILMYLRPLWLQLRQVDIDH